MNSGNCSFSLACILSIDDESSTMNNKSSLLFWW